MLAELLVVASTMTGLAQPDAARIPVPFEVGERAEFAVSYLFARGRASMEVLGLDTIRSRPAYHFRLVIEGGGLGYRLRDTSQSWVDTANFWSLRYHQDAEERGRPRVRRWEIFPERQVYREGAKSEQPSVAAPLDDVSFLFYVRTIPLVVGSTLTLPNYFRPESNPVRIQVLRRERVKVPAGQFDAVVVRPILKTKGIFSEDGKAEVWIADDSTRAILQIKTEMPVLGTLTMALRSYRETAADTVPAPRRE